MKRFIALLQIMLLASCSVNQPDNNASLPSRFCPAFVKPPWEPVTKPLVETQQLIDKQRFAVFPNQRTLWFSAKQDKYIGLCIPPNRSYNRAKSDCGTIYVTYVKKEEEWQLLEQNLTICPV